MRISILVTLLLSCLSACSQDNTSTNRTERPPTDLPKPDTNLPIPDNRNSTNYQVLLFGNSHTTRQAGLIKTLISAGDPDLAVEVVNAGGGFLDDNLNSTRQVTKLEEGSWTHIILQGQKYSQSGSKIYPTSAAQNWIIKTKKKGATPILFPEHPQKGNAGEGMRVHLIHKRIARLQMSCVAPVGLTWDKVLNTSPPLTLHHSDGNHASLTGSLLTALVFYEVITGSSADLLPYIPKIDVDEDTQQLLGQMASETIQANQPCKYEEGSRN
ncbi:hypothetical protein GCM10007978_27480 [Shewanella hanedai]|uniref:SGNH/GDSL hydrolase family protein n=1 Tax=Shewanella hanedai TaxID=25 RepID=A0A553JLA1_SHEHA|nr:hypothetical protein [Shewanella hanedai]TRY13216.1 hypothetical protein FN961_16320 [Shewanella hanedai]GGI88269.1 hypothetical protein GCM10007978_27480 [Shewanella hanedai]